MKKYLHLTLLTLIFASFANAQGPELFGHPILVVPCGRIEAYRNSAWYEPYGLNGFNEFIEEGSANGDTFAYDFSNQSAGAYLIKVETAKGAETMRVMVR